MDWVKIVTSFLDHRKIKLLRAMPSGDSLAFLWIVLLLEAGKCNRGGYLLVTDGLPYTDETISKVLDFELSVVRLGLDTFCRLRMLDVDDGAFYITNWGRYQSADKIDAKRESNRVRQQRYREKLRSNQKLLPEHDTSRVTCNAASHNVTPQNRTYTQDTQDTTTTDVVVVSLETVLTELPARYRDQASVKKLISTTLESHDDEYVISNIRYALRNAKTNFKKYLSESLANDWAEEERVKEQHVRQAAELAREQKAQKEAANLAQDEEFKRRVAEAWTSMDAPVRDIVAAETDAFIAEWGLDPASAAAQSAWMNTVARIAGIQNYN